MSDRVATISTRLRDQAEDNKLEAICNKCGKAYGLTYMRTHVKRVHENAQKKHKCKICEKEFYNHTRLKNHRMRHGGAKSHLCEICMAAFFNDEGLTDHKRGVHPQVDTSDGGEKSFYFCSSVERSSAPGASFINTLTDYTNKSFVLSAI